MAVARRVVVTGVVLCAIGCGGGADESSDVAAAERCPAGPPFAERWPGRIGGGPTTAR